MSGRGRMQCSKGTWDVKEGKTVGGKLQGGIREAVMGRRGEETCWKTLCLKCHSDTPYANEITNGQELTTSSVLSQ